MIFKFQIEVSHDMSVFKDLDLLPKSRLKTLSLLEGGGAVFMGHTVYK